MATDLLIAIDKLKEMSKASLILSLLVLVTLISESISTYLPYLYRSNLFVYHFYVIISFWLYSLIYFFLLEKSKLRIAALFIPVVFSAFAIFNSLNYQTLDRFPSINIIIYNVLLTIYSLYYLKHLIDIDPFESLRKNTLFWFNTSVLIYFTLQIFIWGIMDYLMKNKKDTEILIVISTCASVCYYIMIGISLWTDKKEKAIKQ